MESVVNYVYSSFQDKDNTLLGEGLVAQKVQSEKISLNIKKIHSYTNVPMPGNVFK